MTDDTVNGGETLDGATPNDALGKSPLGGLSGLIGAQGALSLARVPAPANDNAAGEFEPAIYSLAGGHAIVTWVDGHGGAHGHLCAPAEAEGADHWLDPPEYAAVNASLGDLGPVVPTQEAARRIVVVEPRPGTFAIMWLALAESGVAIHGKLFAAQEPTDASEAGQPLWKEFAIAQAALPGFAGGLRVGGEGPGDALLVTYATNEGSHSILLSAAPRSDKPPGVDAQLAGEGPSPARTDTDFAAHFAASPGAKAAAPIVVEGANGLQAGNKQLVLKTVDPPPVSGAHAAEGASEAKSEAKAIVTPIGDHFVVAWQTPGDADGTSQIHLTLFDAQGVAQTLANGSTVLLVSDNAADNVAPAVSRYGDGVAVAYKLGGEHGGLAVKVYGATGVQIGEETIANPGESSEILEIAAASIHGLNGEGHNQSQLAVVYTLEDPGTDAVGNYGNIMLQRLGVVTDAGSMQIVLLGRDGEQGGSNSPGPLMENGPIVGRAPVVAGLDSGELAVVWVEQNGARETIRGGVLQMDGEQVLRIDLTSLIEDGGIIKGTKPTLLDTGDGDILISWLQHDGNEADYVVMAAHYHSAGYGIWVEPNEPIRLKTFDREPNDYAVTFSHAAWPTIIVTWEEDGSGRSGGSQVLSQSFDLAGNGLGNPVLVGSHFALTEQASTDSLAAAGLADGQIVVVYAEQSSDGDTDLAAHIVDVGELSVATGSRSGSFDTGTLGDVQLGDAAGDAKFSTQIDEEIAIDILGSGVGASVARVNGSPIDAATPVDVGAAWVQLREDGWLTVSPDEGYAGTINFACTVTSPTGDEITRSVTVSVEKSDAQDTDPLFNQVAVLAEDVPSQSAEWAGATDPQRLAVESLATVGLDASMFTVVGSTLYLKAGTELEFDTRVRDELHATSGRDTSADSASDGPGDGDPANADSLLFSSHGPRFDHDNDDGELPAAGYATFQRLMKAGALTQVGDDVVIALSHDDPANPSTITLKNTSVADLLDPTFKF